MVNRKILTVVGARPQFVKVAPVSHAFKEIGGMDEVIVHTGQHFDPMMSAIFFKELSIEPPKYNLGVHSKSHGSMTGEMMIKLEEIFSIEKPAYVLVYGDTNSTLAGALVAAKLHIPIIHVESGLRSYNRSMPEEVNRVLTDHVSSVLFCPTFQSVGNLKSEGITEGVFHVGDVMYDACLYAKNKSNEHDLLSKFSLEPQNYGVISIHREENTKDVLHFNDILHHVSEVTQQMGIVALWPIHPRSKKFIEENGLKIPVNIKTCEPLGYLEMQSLLSKAAIVFTDSGGLQKEAYFHQVPCVTLRDETEWTETVSHGWNRLWKDKSYNFNKKPIPEYGDGKSALKIASIVEKLN